MRSAAPQTALCGRPRTGIQTRDGRSTEAGTTPLQVAALPCSFFQQYFFSEQHIKLPCWDIISKLHSRRNSELQSSCYWCYPQGSTPLRICWHGWDVNKLKSHVPTCLAVNPELFSILPEFVWQGYLHCPGETELRSPIKAIQNIQWKVLYEYIL